MKPFLPLVLMSSLLLAACGEKPVRGAARRAAVRRRRRRAFADLAFHPEREAPATVLGKNETRLAAEASARIVAIAVDSGDSVKAGQVLVRLDARDAELALARAEAGLAQSDARLAQAEAQAARARSLKEKNFISAEAVTLRETELAAARADVQSARANRDSARRAVEKCTVTAPFNGIVRAAAPRSANSPHPERRC
jgi:RND family efflux transporter MFP subunit